MSCSARNISNFVSSTVAKSKVRMAVTASVDTNKYFHHKSELKPFRPPKLIIVSRIVSRIKQINAKIHKQSGYDLNLIDVGLFSTRALGFSKSEMKLMLLTAPMSLWLAVITLLTAS